MPDRPVLNGHELSEEDLEQLRQQIESFDHIEEMSEPVRELIAERWPHLLVRLRKPTPQ
jgi:hypothetical protein